MYNINNIYRIIQYMVSDKTLTVCWCWFNVGHPSLTLTNTVECCVCWGWLFFWVVAVTYFGWHMHHDTPRLTMTQGGGGGLSCNHRNYEHNKYDPLTQCCFKVRPASTTWDLHLNTIGLAFAENAQLTGQECVWCDVRVGLPKTGGNIKTMFLTMLF